MAPWNDPRNDTTLLMFPKVEEGSVLIVPSFCHHFVYPNEADKQRVVISFDLLPTKIVKDTRDLFVPDD